MRDFRSRTFEAWSPDFDSPCLSVYLLPPTALLLFRPSAPTIPGQPSPVLQFWLHHHTLPRSPREASPLRLLIEGNSSVDAIAMWFDGGQYLEENIQFPCPAVRHTAASYLGNPAFRSPLLGWKFQRATSLPNISHFRACSYCCGALEGRSPVTSLRTAASCSLRPISDGCFLQHPFHILGLLLALSISPLLALLTCYALYACFSTSSLDHALFLLISISARP